MTPVTFTVLLPVILFGAAFASGRGAALPYEQVVCGDVEALGATWFYNWDLVNPCPGSRAEFVPMIWSIGQVAELRGLSADGWLLGPNEPNYRRQAEALPEQVAAIWPALEATGRNLASPAVSACESKYDRNCLDRYWLEKFMSACAGCRIEAVAVHWYGCDADALAAYLDRRAEQFGKPIWLTEWACPTWAGDPVQFMREALPMVEAKTERNAWFATRTAGFRFFEPLIDDGLTSLGETYRP